MIKRYGFAAAVAALTTVTFAAQAEEGTGIKSALSAIGLVEPDHAPINYRERAPLVLPPKSTLPAPQPSVRNDPAWPKDPEATARARAAAEAKKPITRGEGGRMSDNNTTLPQSELQAGRRPGAGVPRENEYKPGDGVRESTWLNPLKLFEGKKEADAMPSDVEPPRDLLTDPPTGYRKPPGGRLAKTNGDPIGGLVTDRSEADPNAFIRSQRQ